MEEDRKDARVEALRNKLRSWIADCCGEEVGKRFCDQFGCSCISEIIQDLEEIAKEEEGSGPENFVWKCIVCGAELPFSFCIDGLEPPLSRPEVPPSGGLIFYSTGNYGSTKFDPCGTFPEKRTLEVAICDECMEMNKDLFLYCKEKPVRQHCEYMTVKQGEADEKAHARLLRRMYSSLRRSAKGKGGPDEES